MIDIPPTFRVRAVAILACLIIWAACGASTPSLAQQPSGSAGNDASVTYSLSGPAVLRIRGRRELAVALSQSTEAALMSESGWRPVHRLSDADWQLGWRLRQTLCDGARANLCLLERANGERNEWAQVDLSASGTPGT